MKQIISETKFVDIVLIVEHTTE